MKARLHYLSNKEKSWLHILFKWKLDHITFQTKEIVIFQPAVHKIDIEILSKLNIPHWVLWRQHYYKT